MTQQSSVLERYSEGAKEVQPSLCCPVDYDKSLLAILPQEIIEKDYGCGDPSRYVKEGDVVLDLGSGGGKICYMAAQIVGDQGHVHGVDMNDDMLGLAHKYKGQMAEQLGSDRVTFHKGYIQDLAGSLAEVDAYLAESPVNTAAELAALERFKAEQRKTRPMIKDNSVDLVISNCVLNLVDDTLKPQMIKEIFRVLKPGGRVAISDIISDEDVPQHLRDDAHLWSGCISGAYEERAFLEAFVEAGFVAVGYDKWDEQPWQVVEGIEFRSATIIAVKPEATECLDAGQAVIYKGPYKEVFDDEGHVYPRGARIAVCDRTFALLTSGPYADDFIGIQPAAAVESQPYCQAPGTLRPASETKGGQHSSSGADDACCAPSASSGSSCC